MLGRAASQHRNRPYLWSKGESGWMSRTFGEVRETARTLAAGLLKSGFGNGQRLSILSEGRTEWVITEFATLLSGGISVPLSIKLQPEEIEFRVSHSESAFVAFSSNTSEKLLARLNKLPRSVKLLYLDDDEETLNRIAEQHKLKRGKRLYSFAEVLSAGRESLPEAASELDEIERNTVEEDVVTISYTSGTTGNPKGIMLTNRNYYVNVHDAVEMFRVPTAEYRTLLILPCDHSFAHTVGLYAALPRAIEIYFVDARGSSMAALKNIPGNLRETNPVFLLTTPALTANFMKKIRAGVSAKGGIAAKLFEMGLRNGIRYHGDGYHRPRYLTRLRSYIPYKLADRIVFRKVREIFGNSIQFCVGGGALLDRKQQEFYAAIGVPIYQGYGLTEAAPVISSNTPFAHRIGSSGKVAPSVECHILKEDGTECEIGETGEIAIRGENVMAGYFKNDTATFETIRDGMLLTGDRGYLDDDGFLYVVGREKALLIAPDGEKYSPEEIEEAIVNSSDLIDQAVVYNDHSPYTGALITLDRERADAVIKERNVQSASEFLDLVREELYRFRDDPAYARRFPSQWIPSTFQVLEEPFSEDNGTVNSTMKIVRHKVLEVFEERVNDLYAEDGQNHRNDANLRSVRSLFSLE